MLRNGTVAVITLFGIGYFFGAKNMMLAFPIALTSTVLGRQNFYVKTLSKIITILILELVIVIVAYLSSINMWSGLIINFIAIFLLMYTIVSPYDVGFYKPFIMLYIFTQYVTVSIDELPNRLLSVVFGCISITLVSLIKKSNEKVVLINNIKSSIIIIKNQLDNIISSKFKEKLTDKCSKMMRALAYKIYVTRYKDYLTTELGKIQYKMFIYIEYLNLYIKVIDEQYKIGNVAEGEIEEVIGLLNEVIECCKENSSINNSSYNIGNMLHRNKYKSKYIKEIRQIINIIISNIKELLKMDKNQINKVYMEWQRTDYDRKIHSFKDNFKKDSMRFKFAMRMSITLTTSLFAAEILGFYKVIWAVITIMSIMQPYYENTVANARARIRGNTIAIIITGLLINLVSNKIFTLAILIISLYLLYAFKEYSRISLYAGIASICISSLTDNVNKLIFYRIGYIIVGVIVVLLANKFILPYRLSDGIRQLQERINKYTLYLKKEYRRYIKYNNNQDEIMDLIIHITLLSQRLYLKNLEYDDENIEIYLKENNKEVIEIGYNVLREKMMKNKATD